MTTLKKLDPESLDKTNPLNESHTQTGDGRVVGPFLENLAHDERFGTYHASTAAEFREMVVAVRDYFVKLVEVEGADMPGLFDLEEAMEYVANGRTGHQYIEQPDGSFINRDKLHVVD